MVTALIAVFLKKTILPKKVDGTRPLVYCDVRAYL